jgi:sporulation protein YlmC with PRC-barrel domain
MAFQSDPMNRTENRQGEFPHDETNNLVASDKVEGTAVYNRDGEKLGTVKNFMVGKRNGRVEYAVMSFGGLFGIGERYHPLPWDTLDYSKDQGGFVVDIDKEQLKSGPSYEKGNEPEFNREYGEQVYGHYGRSY